MREALDRRVLQKVYNRVARRYDIQHGLLTGQSDQVGRSALVELIVGEGDSILDCGAGTGTAATQAADRSGEDGLVVLLDNSVGMLSVAQEKALKGSRRSHMVFTLGDMTALPFDDNSFDAVMTTYSLCPVFYPDRAVREMYRVCRPGGRIGVAHSIHPKSRLVRCLADLIKGLAWHFPSISLGCRAISVMNTFEQLGCHILYSRRFGFPLWPFLLFVAKKPE